MIPAESGGGPPGDPGALRAAATKLAGAGTTCANGATKLNGTVSGVGDSWKGQASSMWRSLGSTHHVDLAGAGRALHDTAHALTTYATKLESAQRAYATASSRADGLTHSISSITASDPTGSPTGLDGLRGDLRQADQAMTTAMTDAHTAAVAAAAEFHRIAGAAPRHLMSCPAPATFSGGSSPAAPTEPNLTLLLGTVRSGANGEPVELDLQDPAAIRGASPKTIDEVARAQGWEAVPAKRGGGGMRYFKPGTNRSEGIRVMNGDPNAPEGVKQDPYAMITRGGQKTRVPLEGNPTLDQEGGPGPYASGGAPKGAEPKGPVEVPGEAPVEPVEPVEPVVPVEPVEPIDPIEPFIP